MAASPERIIDKTDIGKTDIGSNDSIAEQFKIEKQTGFRHEWAGGKLRAMAGASANHVTIVSNLIRRFGNQLEGKGCQPWSNDIRVKIPVLGNRYFPDVIVACPPHEWDEKIPHTLLNPRVVIKVLSPSTSDIDRSEKLRAYFRLPSLTDYVLVASREMFVTHLHRQGDGDWKIHIADTPESELLLESIECRVALAEIYERLEFEAESLAA